MKTTLTLFLLLVLCGFSAPAQTAKSSPAGNVGRGQSPVPATRGSEVFQLSLGGVNVALPAPQGFAEAASQVELIKERFTQTEDPGNEMMAVHVPTESLAQLKRGEIFDLDFFTKVSVSRRLKGVNMTAPEFADLISALEKGGVKLLDLDGPEMRGKIESLEKTLADLSAGKAQFDISPPEMLGAFDKKPNVYSIMMLIRAKAQDTAGTKNVVIVGGASFVRVKQRLLYVYTYRTFKSGEDIELLKSFTKRWTDQIVATNQR